MPYKFSTQWVFSGVMWGEWGGIPVMSDRLNRE